MIQQRFLESLGRDFTSATEKLGSRDQTLGAKAMLPCRKTQYRSKAPHQERTHIHLDLVECDYPDESAAQAGLKHFLMTAHPDAGHSYNGKPCLLPDLLCSDS